MGQDLQIGLCYRVEISRKDISYQGLTEQEVLNEIVKIFDLTIYKREDTDDLVVFTLKDQYLENNLSSFLENQFRYFVQESYYQDLQQKTLQAIKERKTVVELLDLAETKSLINFQKNIFVDTIQIKGWRSLDTRFTILIFELVGKVYIEQYRDFLVYLVNLIRKVSVSNPLAGAVYASIN